MPLAIPESTRREVPYTIEGVSRLEEHVEVWRMLWRGEPVTWRGDDVDLVEHTIGPLPWRAGGPPVLITAGNRGEMLDAQFVRFARLGRPNCRPTCNSAIAGSLGRRKR